MLPNSFPLGPLIIHFYGLVIAIAIILGWTITKRRAPLSKIKADLFDDPLLLLPLIFGIIGGRLYHVIDKWGYYSQNPGQILAVTNGGLGIFGALAGIFIGFWVFAKIKKIDFFKLLDLIAPALILGQAIGRIGNFVNQEGFGPPTNLPWAVYIDPMHRPAQYLFFTHFHPTFFYEAVLETIAFLVLIKMSGKLKLPGQTFGLYLILYAVSRAIAENWRIDTATLGTIKVAYLILIPIFIFGFWLITRTKLKN